MAKARSAPKDPPAAQQLPNKPLLQRLYWALGRLRSNKPIKAKDIAEEFEVNVRTAYRDLDFLRDQWRVPIEYDRGKATYVLTEPTAELPAVALSQGELIALYFAEKVLAQYRGTPFEPNLASAFHKIQELLPEHVWVSPSSLDDYLSFEPGPLYTPEAEVFSDLLTARRIRRKLLIRYRSPNSNRTVQRRIHPYHVFNHRGDWYVAAWDERRKDIRTFALHRIRRATPTTEPFEIPARFSFRKYMQDAFGIQKGHTAVNVSIRFAPRQAPWIRERKWHQTARVQEGIGGSLVLHLKVAETSEIKRWVMQFGSEAEVLKPASLRKTVKDDLQAAQVLEILEKGEGEVQELEAFNKGKSPVVILEGETLVGCKQNRVVARSVILGKGKKIPIPVGCMEQGRWSWKSGHFGSGAMRVAPSVRSSTSAEIRAAKRQRVARPAVDQSRLWEDVDSTLTESSVASGTSDYHALLEERSDEARERSRSLERQPGQVGVLVMAGDTFLGLELAGHPDTWNELADRTLPAFLMDHAWAPDEARTRKARRRDATAWLTRIQKAQITLTPGLGQGKEIDIEDGGLAGSGLWHKKQVVHLAVFAS